MKKFKIKVVFFTMLLTIGSAPLVYADFWDDLGDVFTGGGGGGSGGSGGSLSDPFTDVLDKITGLGNDITGLGDDIAGLSTDIGKQITDQYTDITGFFEDEYNNLVDIIGGIDPSEAASAIVATMQDESLCKTLPSQIDGVVSNVISQLGIPEEFASKLQIVQFSDLVRPIDPATATDEDIYLYNVQTMRPLNALRGMSQSYIKIPFVVASEIAQSCVDAAQFRLSQRSSDEELTAKIHNVLGSKDLNNIKFQLPNANNGYLEDVEKVLADTFATYSELGMKIPHSASRQFEHGQYYFSQGQYMKAFRSYKKSYQRLAKGDHEHHRDRDRD
ncbi:MAG TPA: hypothetical protein ENJ60_02565 [Aeromonadales bacterium]|nr:hypothetical protein [Aeromonadales bacterium]